MQGRAEDGQTPLSYSKRERFNLNVTSSIGAFSTAVRPKSVALLRSATGSCSSTTTKVAATSSDASPCALLVTGGSGITPFFSIIREFIFQSVGYGDSPTIHLICVFKTSADLTMLDLLLPISSNASSISCL
ncbi:hypothetical protein Taro_046888 [Colocasia esculenta]|uniref:Ferric reductase NAD binding domain-containing protein n=1 Tax=Colocasia esculenta TaxID=4460 RepID=A0A843X4R0_COLES|nr:hypothetical protein [Colocasia esculenta]